MGSRRPFGTGYSGPFSALVEGHSAHHTHAFSPERRVQPPSGKSCCGREPVIFGPTRSCWFLVRSPISPALPKGSPRHNPVSASHFVDPGLELFFLWAKFVDTVIPTKVLCIYPRSYLLPRFFMDRRSPPDYIFLEFPFSFLVLDEFERLPIVGSFFVLLAFFPSCLGVLLSPTTRALFLS